MSSDSPVPETFVAGITQAKKLIKSNSVKCAYVASNADKKIHTVMNDLCREVGVYLDSSHTLEELGRMCNIEVNCAACVLLK